ncbi:amidohydrolase family protein [Shimia sp. Alg240-R146]|uniref:amidohydrolase family protein n=1 Tax=Shimia sp. Alg240-R146 TaxID=2993449 RepID=UPI0022E4E672|nr:amidohydrolase family protein [Shimia sp. Alg240-R146]
MRSATGFGGIVEGAYLRGDLICKNGGSPRLLPASLSPAPKLVLPRFTEAHVHLDKCHSVDRMPAVGGNLRAAIDAQSQDKAFWSEEDLRARATRGLQELISAGCKAARSHVDWSHGEGARTPPLAWHILKELAQDFRDHITLNLAPLTSLEDLADPQTAKTLVREISCVGGALGSFVLDQPNLPKGIQTAFEIAMHHGIALDFHVDEGLADGLDGLELIARTAIETGFDGPILCGHACSMMNLSGDAMKRRINLVAQSGLSVVTLPSTNLYLQGRTEGTPDRRGLTRVRELRASSVPVIVGTDNVRDAFCPLGRHNPRASLALAVLAAHLDPPLADLWPMITTDAAQALGMAQTFVDEASIDDLLVCDAPSTTSALDDSTQLYPLKTYADRTVA